MGCPLCDDFGAVADPLRPGSVKKCPECDTPPVRLPNLAELCFGPDGPGEDDDVSELVERLAGIRRLEDRLAADGRYDAGVSKEQRAEVVRLYDAGHRG